MTKTVITNVLVFDGETVTGPRNFTIEGPTIDSAVNAGSDESDQRILEHAASTIDGTGHTLLPGLIDAHVHMASAADLDTLARHGVTTALDMGAMPAGTLQNIRAATAARSTPTTAYFSAGVPAYAPSADVVKFAAMIGMPDAANWAVADTPTAAADYVTARLADEADYIKAYADEPGFPQTQLDTLAERARSAGKMSVAHALHVGTWERALTARFDVLTHVPTEAALPDAVVERAVAQGTVAVPTLSMMWAGAEMAKAHPQPGGRASDYAYAREAVGAMLRKGVPVVAGSDSNSLPMMQHSHGESFWRELELLVEAGMAPLDVLRCCTSQTAKLFSLANRGAIKPGMRADFVLVKGNPAENISDCRAVTKVWIEGQELSLGKNSEDK